MTALDFNDRVRAAMATQRLPGVSRGGSSTFLSKWTVSAVRVPSSAPFDFGINPLTGQPFFSASVFSKPAADPLANRLWQINVGTGCVNDEPACIEYLQQNDPRGWDMPKNYPPAVAINKVFGPSYPFVDRPLWEDPAPVLYLTAPSADGADLGGFSKTLDTRRPQYFRTADAWDTDLYQASVFVSITPFRADPSALNLAILGPRATRWRVVAGQIPFGSDTGVSGLATLELARIWLQRTPGFPALDQITVQQLVYWDVMARSIIDVPFLELIAAVNITVDLGLIALSLVGGTGGLSFAVALLGLQAEVINLVLGNLQAIIAATSTVDFWTV